MATDSGLPGVGSGRKSRSYRIFVLTTDGCPEDCPQEEIRNGPVKRILVLIAHAESQMLTINPIISKPREKHLIAITPSNFEVNGFEAIDVPRR